MNAGMQMPIGIPRPVFHRLSTTIITSSGYYCDLALPVWCYECTITERTGHKFVAIYVPWLSGFNIFQFQILSFSSWKHSEAVRLRNYPIGVAGGGGGETIYMPIST